MQLSLAHQTPCIVYEAAGYPVTHKSSMCKKLSRNFKLFNRERSHSASALSVSAVKQGLGPDTGSLQKAHEHLHYFDLHVYFGVV